MFGEEDRPDKVGAVYRYDGQDGGANVFTVWEVFLGARYEPAFESWVARVRKLGPAGFVIVGPESNEVRMPDGGLNVSELICSESEIIRLYKEGGLEAVRLLERGVPVEEAIRRGRMKG